MISLSLIALAAMFNAVMDRTGDVVAFNRSIFQNLPDKFWCKEISWKYAKKIFGWKADCWHMAKSLMVVALILAVVFYVLVLYGGWIFLLVDFAGMYHLGCFIIKFLRNENTNNSKSDDSLNN